MVEVVEADPDVFDKVIVVFAVVDCFSAAGKGLKLERELCEFVGVSVPGICDGDDLIV